MIIFILAILTAPFVLIWECVKQNEKAHYRSKRRKRKY